MVEESPTMPLNRFTTEYFSDSDEYDIDGYVNGSNLKRIAENDEDNSSESYDDNSSGSEEGEINNSEDVSIGDSDNENEEIEDTFEDRGGDSHIINADKENPPLSEVVTSQPELALASSIECRFLNKFLKSQKVRVDVADADLLLLAQQALFDNLRNRSNQKPIKGKPAIPPPTLLTCQRICSQALCNKLLKAINDAQDGRPEGRPRAPANAPRSTINGRLLKTPSASKVAQAAAIDKAAANKAIADENIKMRNQDIASNLASGNATLNAMSNFLLQFQVNFPGSRFNDEGEAYFNSIKSHITALSRFAYDSRECLDLIVALESAQVDLARKFAGTSTWGHLHMQSLRTNAADIESRRKEREALMARNIAAAAAANLKNKRSDGYKGLSHLTTIRMVRRSLHNRKTGLRNAMIAIQEREDLLFNLLSKQKEADAQAKADINKIKTKRTYVDLQFQSPPPVIDALKLMPESELDKQISDTCKILIPLFEERKRRFDAVIKTDPNGEIVHRKSTMITFVFSISGGESQFEINEHLVGRDADLLDLARGRYGHTQAKAISATIKESKRHVKVKYNMDLNNKVV